MISTLRRHATRPYPERVQTALAVLGSTGNPVPVLVEALADADSHLRLLAVEVLAESEPDDRTLPALIVALGDPDRLVRIAAVEQVARFGLKAKSALPALQRWLSEDERFRLSAAAAISKIDPEQIDRVLPILVAGLDSENSLWRGMAAEAIGDLGEAAAAALPKLEARLRDDCAALRCDAALAIRKITGDRAEAIAVGVNLLDAGDWLERYVGAEHLGLLGSVAAPASPDLRVMLQDGSPAVRTAAAKALEAVEGGL